MTRFMRIILIIVIAFLIFIFFTKDYSRKDLTYKDIVIGGKEIKATIADNMVLRKNGLSNKDSLDKNTGMLFIFKSPAKYSFWMKGMRFPIDIIWIDKNQEIIGFDEKISEDSSKNFTPKSAVKYVLEVNSGFIEKNNLQINNKLIIKDN